MDMKVLLGFAIIFSLILVPSIYAETGYECVDGNLFTNMTVGGEEVPITIVCENGCAPISGGRYTCITVSFVMPMEMYILLEIVGFVFFFTMFSIHYFSKTGNPFPFGLIALIIFGALGMASFNVEGLLFMTGAALNWGMFMFCMAFVILDSIDQIPGRI